MFEPEIVSAGKTEIGFSLVKFNITVTEIILCKFKASVRRAVINKDNFKILIALF